MHIMTTPGLRQASRTDLLLKKLRRWQKRHGNAAKVAATHRQVLLERVVESMAFENEPVTMARLRSLLKSRSPKALK
jgi:hypothetical protein